MDEIIRFVMEITVVEIKTQKDFDDFKKVTELLNLNFVVGKKYSLEELKNLLAVTNQRPPVDENDTLCFAFNYYKGFSMDWKHNFVKEINDGYYSNFIGVESLKADLQTLLNKIKGELFS